VFADLETLDVAKDNLSDQDDRTLIDKLAVDMERVAFDYPYSGPVTVARADRNLAMLDNDYAALIARCGQIIQGRL
jgi:hypothetical protein